MQTISFTRRTVTVCNAQSSKEPSKSKKILNDFHKKRSETFKKNANDLVRVSQSEIHELDVFFKELDIFHKSQFEELKKNFKKPETTVPVESPDVSAGSTTEEGSSENIFLEK